MAQRWAQKKKTCVAEQIFSVMVHNYKSSRMTCFKGLNGYTGFQLLCTIFWSLCESPRITRQQKRHFILRKATYTHSSKFLGYMMLRITSKKDIWAYLNMSVFPVASSHDQPIICPSIISRASRGKLSFSITRLWYLPAWNGLQDKWSVFCIKKKQC